MKLFKEKKMERIVYKGKVFDIERDTNEPKHIFWDRAWYIVKNSHKDRNVIQNSFLWANKKHLHCSY